MESAQRVRHLWNDFEVWAQPHRARLEQETRAIEDKWRHKATWANSKQGSPSSDVQRQREIRDVQERYTTTVRTEWDRRLNAHKLRDSDWGYIQPEQQMRIEVVLGGDLEAEPSPAPSSLAVVTAPTPPQPQRPPQPQLVATQAPPAASRPAPAPIQPVAPLLNGPLSAGPSSLSFNASTRSANTSSSSYTFVNPADFTTDDELFEPGSSYVIPTDDSEDDSISITNPEAWGIPSIGRSSNRSSQSSSPDYPNTHVFDQPSAFSKPDLHTPSPKRPLEIDKPTSGKPRARGPSYIGPKLHDEDDKSEEELEFEKFKMHTRITKIWEFHFAAAQADVELAMNIYNDRQTKKVTGGKSDDASRIAHHEKRMLKIQAEKEIERKALVSEERKKRRDAIKKRGALKEPSKNANIADPTSANKSWGDFFNADSTHIAFDANGRLIHSREVVDEEPEEPEELGEEDEEDEEEDDQDFGPVTNGRGQFGTLKASSTSGASKSFAPTPADRSTPSGWKNNFTPAASAWDAPSTTAAPPPPTKSNNPFAAAAAPQQQQPQMTFVQAQDSAWGNGFSEDRQIPGHFSDESPTTPTLGSWMPWGNSSSKKPAVPSKLAQVQSAPSPPRPVPEQDEVSFDVPPTNASTSATRPNGKKPALTAAAKKRLAASQQKANSAPAVPTLATPEVETRSPVMPARVPDTVANPKDLLHQKWAAHAEEELSSTPRPSLMTGIMKKGLSGGLNPHAQAHEYFSDAALTPRAPQRTLNNGMHASAATDNETPWERHQRLTAGGQAPVPKAAASQVFADDDDDDEPSIWSRAGMKQRQANPVQPMARAVKTAPAVVQHQQPQEEESLWNQVMKSKVQAPSNPQPISNVNIAEMEDQARIWDQMKRAKAGQSAGNSAKPVNGLRSGFAQQQAPPQQPDFDDESPWQRMQRLKEMAANVASTAPPPAPPVPAKHSWGPPNDFEPAPLHQQYANNTFENANQFWPPQKPAPRAQQSAWGAPTQARVAPSSRTAKRITNGGTVMIEDVQDDEDAEAWGGRGSTLPPDSTVLLDIAVPKPSKPSGIYDNIIGYGEDGEEDEEGYNTGLSSSVPTPSTAPTSPPNDVPMEDDWLASVAEDVKNGNWDSVVERARQEDFPPASHAMPILAMKQKPKTAWGAASFSKGATTQGFDTAKLRSALEQVSSTPTANAPSPPKAFGAKVSPPAPTQVADKAPAVPTKIETPVEKPAPAPSVQAKGKGKKGKGRK